MQPSWVVATVVGVSVAVVVAASLIAGRSANRREAALPRPRNSREQLLRSMTLLGTLLMTVGGIIGLVAVLSGH